MRLLGRPRPQTVAERLAIARDFFRFFGIDPRQLLQNLYEAGAPILRRFRKISSAPKRHTVRVEKHGKWPAALFAHH